MAACVGCIKPSCPLPCPEKGGLLLRASEGTLAPITSLLLSSPTAPMCWVSFLGHCSAGKGSPYTHVCRSQEEHLPASCVEQPREGKRQLAGPSERERWVQEREGCSLGQAAVSARVCTKHWGVCCCFCRRLSVAVLQGHAQGGDRAHKKHSRQCLPWRAPHTDALRQRTTQLSLF